MKEFFCAQCKEVNCTIFCTVIFIYNKMPIDIVLFVRQLTGYALKFDRALRSLVFQVGRVWRNASCSTFITLVKVWETFFSLLLYFFSFSRFFTYLGRHVCKKQLVMSNWNYRVTDRIYSFNSYIQVSFTVLHLRKRITNMSLSVTRVIFLLCWD